MLSLLDNPTDLRTKLLKTTKYLKTTFYFNRPEAKHPIRTYRQHNISQKNLPNNTCESKTKGADGETMIIV